MSRHVPSLLALVYLVVGSLASFSVKRNKSLGVMRWLLKRFRQIMELKESLGSNPASIPDSSDILSLFCECVF